MKKETKQAPAALTRASHDPFAFLRRMTSELDRLFEESGWPALPDIEVFEKNHRLVTLRGDVKTYSEKATAERVALGVYGVKAVANDVNVRLGDTQQGPTPILRGQSSPHSSGTPTAPRAHPATKVEIKAA